MLLKRLSHRRSCNPLLPALGALFVFAGALLQASEVDLPALRRQLQAAREASDNPAIIEISRRIVDADPTDSQAWETLANKQLELDDEIRCAATLDAWQAQIHPPPKIIDDI